MVEEITTTDVESIKHLINAQRSFYRSGATRDVDFRIKSLNRLKKVIKSLEKEIYAALTEDLQKPKFETYTSEIGMIYEDINLMVSKLKLWTKPQLQTTGITNFPAKSYVYSEPFGVSLIIGAWNYPLQLTLVPLVGAIAAGNCAIVKPSELSVASSSIIAKIVEKAFDKDHVAVVEGGIEVSQALLEQKFDFIFFTGSTNVGRIVNMAAAKHLTPVVLELGGKSPCIVDETADIDLAARRICWGKFFNAGQSCVAPDYVLVHHSKKVKLIQAIEKTIEEFFGADPQKSSDLSRIVSKRHFDRLINLLKDANVVIGGTNDEEFRYLSPTVVDLEDSNHPLMEDEIFGPILPIISINSLEDAIEKVYDHPNPLALYIFSTRYKNQQKVINSLNFGGGCINDTVAHVANNGIPFGGIGSSGMGQYHGKASFEIFSHKKSILHKAAWPDVPLRYPPYKGKLTLIKQIIK